MPSYRRSRQIRMIRRLINRRNTPTPINNDDMLRLIESLPPQQTTDPLANQLFNGSSFN